jgi:DNA invertase Pin-like site-specific DNA recombinase
MIVTRPGLTQALSHLRAGDTLVVWRLDRLGRSLPHLIETVSAHVRQGVGFRSLQEQIDTTTSGGKLVFHVFGALAEFERDLIRERTHAGLAAARKRGRLFGRPKVLSPRKITQLRTLAKDERTTEGGRQSRVS